jgi:arsenate reductase (thioredoxin)
VATERKRIMFLCTGNAARSQMSEALARIDHGDLIEPHSSGSRPAGFVHPLAIRAIEELGFGIGNARSKAAAELFEERFDVVVTVCDSAAADCPVWPGAKNVLNWSIEDPSFLPGSEEVRLEAFRATRDDLRRRIDTLVEAFPRRTPKRTDEELLAKGAAILDDVMRLHGFRWEKPKRVDTGGRTAHVGRYARVGRALELQVRSGVSLATWEAGRQRLRHPEYMEKLGVREAMRYPGVSKDPLDAFRRLRADVARFGGPFLSGDGIKEFRAWSQGPKHGAREPGPSRL